MWLVDALQIVLNANCPDQSCPTTAFSALAAAFTTQGYFAQANFLEFVTDSGLGQATTLIYMLAGFGAIIAYVLGSPPRNYLWFLIGPAVYNWLIFNPVEVQGVRVIGADPAGTTAEEQVEVWRLAEPGLASSSIVTRSGAQGQITATAPPPWVEVAMPFLWADILTSDFVEQLVRMTGVYELPAGGGNTQAPGGGSVVKNWAQLSDLKGSMMLDITGAKLKNGDARDAFVTFLASECGDVFSQYVDEGKWITATVGEGHRVPATVLKDGQINLVPPILGGFIPPINIPVDGALVLQQALRKEAIPIPDSFRNLVRPPDTPYGTVGADSRVFYNSAQFIASDIAPYVAQNTGVGGMTCDAYLWTLVHAFLFESGHVYYQTFNNGPGDFRDAPEDVLRSLFYGWGLGTDPDEWVGFAKNLIFIHMLRNEFAIAPQPVSVRYAASKDAQNYVDEYARTLGTQTKFGEIYAWALMMPYIQGVTLYVLAMAYPFACMFVVIPGWHKIIFTWLSFWIWVKFWDVGFAIVKVIERSIWAMIGTSQNAFAINSRILGMDELGTFQTNCSGGAGCMIPEVTYDPGTVQGMLDETNALQLFDTAMAIGANVDFDITNSYYFHIMAALYFAVPAVTGQIILGAKAGASSLVGGMVSGFSDKVGAAAGTGFTGDLAQRAQTNIASFGQGAFGKNMRQGGIAAQAIEQSNLAASAGLDASGYGTASQMMGNLGQTGDRIANRHQAMMQPVRTWIDTSLAPFAAANPNASNFNPALGQAQPPGATAGATAGGTSGPSAQNPGGGGMTGLGYTGRGTRYAGALSQPLMPGKYPALSVGNQSAIAAVAGDNADFQNEVGAGQSARAAGQFMAGSMKDQAGMHGQRLEGYSGWDSANKTWGDKRDFGNQIAGRMAVAGVLPGSLAPGAKPDPTKDSAMSGILNTYSGNAGGGMFGSGTVGGRQDVAGSANFAAPGGQFGQRTSAWSGTLAPIGAPAVRHAYDTNRATMGSAWGNTISNQPALTMATGPVGVPQVGGDMPAGAGPVTPPKP